MQCQDRLVGARIIVSETSDYTFAGEQSCGSVDEAESPIGEHDRLHTCTTVLSGPCFHTDARCVADEQEIIIKSCEADTVGRFVTVVGPNRDYPNADNLYLTLCEVAVYGDCPNIPAQQSLSDSEALGSNCELSLSHDVATFNDAERACKAAGGHLASIHSAAEAEQARALVAASPFSLREVWIGMNDRKVECGPDKQCYVWVDGTPMDFTDGWKPNEPNAIPSAFWECPSLQSEADGLRG